MKTKQLLLLLTLLGYAFHVSAQSSFNQVYTILQSNCAATCHNASQIDGGLQLDGSETDVYNNLVGVAPTNATAAANGYSLIEPGFPYRSFLMRKIGHSLDSSLTITAAEGGYMPATGSITDLEAEMVRQWILWGAKDTGALFNAQVITDYYDANNTSNHPFINRPASPQEEGKNGYQIRIGPFFMEPGEEVERFKKETMEHYFNGPQDIVGLSALMNSESHHFALFNLDPAQAYPTSLVRVESANDQLVIHFSATEVGAWNVSLNIPMPTNAAYKWPELTHLVLDYHIFNSHSAGILPADAWLNVYTEAPDPAREEMSLVFPNYGDFNPWILQIPPTGQPHTETMVVRKPGSNETWKVWRMQGHTHSIGTDYNVWLRNADGSKGDLIYEGKYNFDYTINQGFYEYAHAPIKKWEPYLEVDAETGFILEATYLNNTADTIGFGLTTQDEMFAGYIHYVAVQKTTGIGDVDDLNSLDIYPNPVTDFAQITLPEDALVNPYSISVYDVSGRLVLEQADVHQTTYMLDLSAMEKGVYLVELIGTETYRTKLMVH